MSANITGHLAPNKVARIAGGFYLGFILASVLADTLGHIGLGESEEVYETLATDAGSFRLGLVIALIALSFVAEVGLVLWLLITRTDRGSGRRTHRTAGGSR